MYIEFMKRFHLAESKNVLEQASRRYEQAEAVRLISASWAQKRLIPTF